MATDYAFFPGELQSLQGMGLRNVVIEKGTCDGVVSPGLRSLEKSCLLRGQPERGRARRTNGQKAKEWPRRPKDGGYWES